VQIFDRILKVASFQQKKLWMLNI